MKIAYLTGEYPRATDTFIQREVAALRKQGVQIKTFSVRPTGEEHMVGEEQKQETKQEIGEFETEASELCCSYIVIR